MSRIVTTASIAVGSFFLGQNIDLQCWTYTIFPGLSTGKLATANIPSTTNQYNLEKTETGKDGKPLNAWNQPSRAAEIMKFGWPGFDNLRTYEDFVLSYDRKTRTAHWVIEHLTPDRLIYDPSVDRNKCQFKPDESIHEYFRSQNSDYFVSFSVLSLDV